MMGKSVRAIAASLLYLLRLASAAPTQETTQACTEINDALPGKVLTPSLLALEYDFERQQYWSTTLRGLRPACIAQPASAEDVSAIVKILNKYSSVQFATRSGGHDPNVGHSSIADGVLIVMTDLTGATYDPETQLATVLPGGEWNDVIGDLEPSGVTIAGGRLGLVGVGGLLLGGGLSFLSAQEGLAADNIVGWETVLANGTIVNVDATANPDLARAMRGSGSQFGIVTKYTVKTHPIGLVWGGACFYDTTNDDQMFAALHNFIANGAEDPKAAIIHSNLLLVGGIKSALINYFYDGPNRPETGPFADFFSIINPLCLPKTQKYSELLRSNGETVRLLNARISFRTYTVPFIATRPQMYVEIREALANITNEFRLLHPESQFSVAFQPVPSIIGQHSEEKGGNAMGLSGSDPIRIFLEIQGSWQFPSNDAEAYGLTKQLTDWLDEQVPQWLDEAGQPQEYMPMFMNDAAGDQRIFQSYKDYEEFKALQQQMDPNAFFSTRAGGFKY